MPSNTRENDFLNLVREFDDSDELRHDTAAAAHKDRSETYHSDHKRSSRRRNSVVNVLSTMVEIIRTRSARLSFDSVKTTSLDDEHDGALKKQNSKKINKKVKRIAWFRRIDRAVRRNRVKVGKIVPQPV